MKEHRIPVAVLGATGSVGQRMVSLLSEHPWFRLAEVTASERSAGRPYADAVRWLLPDGVPLAARNLDVLPTGPALESPLVFSALDASVAGPVEAEYARLGHLVVSNARNHRMDPDVPLLVPEVNSDHLALLSVQPYGSGGLVTNPNCSTIGLTLALAPLHQAFGVELAHVVTLQAVSGAGVPGVSSMAALDNVIPYISGEEDKLESETRKIFGTLSGAEIEPAQITVSAQCTRVPVLDGHTLCVSLSLSEEPTPEDVVACWAGFRGEPQRLWLPSAPPMPVIYLDGDDVPQARLHRDAGQGMSATVGRWRPCPVLGHKFVTVSHNTIRGAAGGSLLCAELVVARGDVPGLSIPGTGRA